MSALGAGVVLGATDDEVLRTGLGVGDGDEGGVTA